MQLSTDIWDREIVGKMKTWGKRVGWSSDSTFAPSWSGYTPCRGGLDSPKPLNGNGRETMTVQPQIMFSSDKGRSPSRQSQMNPSGCAASFHRRDGSGCCGTLLVD